MQVLENVQLDFEMPYMKRKYLPFTKHSMYTSVVMQEMFTLFLFFRNRYDILGPDDSLILVNIKLKSII